MNKQKGISTLLIILIIVGLVVIVVGGMFAYKYYYLKPKPLQTDNLIVNVPLANQSVTSPIVIKGKARNIFFEGEFPVMLLGYDYPLGHPKYAESSRVITSATARIVGDCDWVRSQWCDFEATINYPSSGTGVENMLYFYDGGQGNPGTPAAPKFVAALPIKLK